MSQGMFEVIMMFSIKILYVLSIYFDAVSDAIIDDTKHRNHLYELLTIACLGCVILLTWGYSDSISVVTLLMYLPLRMGLFNVIYNKKRNLPYHYVGKSDAIYDKWIYWMHKIETRPKLKLPILTIYYFFIGAFGFFMH